jgi:hypothetical protein
LCRPKNIREFALLRRAAVIEQLLCALKWASPTEAGTSATSILQVESCRMLHQTDAGGVGHALGNQAVDERDDAPEDIGYNGPRELGREQNAQPVQETATEPLLERFGLIRRLHQQHNVLYSVKECQRHCNGSHRVLNARIDGRECNESLSFAELYQPTAILRHSFGAPLMRWRGPQRTAFGAPSQEVPTAWRARRGSGHGPIALRDSDPAYGLLPT